MFVLLILVELLTITVKAFLLTQFHFYICSIFTDGLFFSYSKHMLIPIHPH
jgi:hypothetical protein